LTRRRIDKYGPWPDGEEPKRRLSGASWGSYDTGNVDTNAYSFEVQVEEPPAEEALAATNDQTGASDWVAQLAAYWNMLPSLVAVDAVGQNIGVKAEEGSEQLEAAFAAAYYGGLAAQNQANNGGDQEITVECNELSLHEPTREYGDTGKEILPDIEGREPYWARACPVTYVQLPRGNGRMWRALIDSGSEINLMAAEVANGLRIPRDPNPHWSMVGVEGSSVNSEGAAAHVLVKMADVIIPTNFHLRKQLSHPLILGQPWITDARMESKVLTDGTHGILVHSKDGMRAVQLMVVESNHARHREDLTLRRTENIKPDFLLEY
jgi:hypothetical protein